MGFNDEKLLVFAKMKKIDNGYPLNQLDLQLSELKNIENWASYGQK